jgi:hypothetical protein
VTRNRGSFPTQETAIKLLYVALQNVSQKWQFVQGWREALRQFTISWPDLMETCKDWLKQKSSMNEPSYTKLLATLPLHCTAQQIAQPRRNQKQSSSRI